MCHWRLRMLQHQGTMVRSPSLPNMYQRPAQWHYAHLYSQLSAALQRGVWTEELPTGTTASAAVLPEAVVPPVVCQHGPSTSGGHLMLCAAAEEPMSDDATSCETRRPVGRAAAADCRQHQQSHSGSQQLARLLLPAKPMLHGQLPN